MPGCMLNKPCFVTETIITIFSHAMEMSLMLSVIATCESTIFIEPVWKVNTIYLELAFLNTKYNTYLYEIIENELLLDSKSYNGLRNFKCMPLRITVKRAWVSFVLLHVFTYILSLFMTCHSNLEVIAVRKYNRKKSLIS